jgi:ring-1,2-phenylacetyl-CoA epoxidase subunit PaaD
VSTVVSPFLKKRVLDVLSRVPDPEIPCISVVDLGIVREVTDDSVAITPTYMGCPAAVAIEASIRAALDLAGFARVRIQTVLSPPWTTDWISKEGHEKLRAYGIAPPRQRDPKRLADEGPVECPRCGSSRTKELSGFGSTPCKSLHRCLDCLEPFDHFKCH